MDAYAGSIPAASIIPANRVFGLERPPGFINDRAWVPLTVVAP